MGYSNKTPILQLIALLKSYHIDNVVVCPGSRNAPIVHSLVETSTIKCYQVTDERSAAFIAIGMADALGSPVAVCCTSGSALLDMAPAVAEAYYRGVPLLILSADRPKEWIDQMDGQTINQTAVFGPLAKSFTISETDSQWYSNRIINEAFANLQMPTSRPVHLNIQIDEPLFSFNQQSLPIERFVNSESVMSISLSDKALEEWRNAKRPMIIVGQLSYQTASIIKPYIDCLIDNQCAIVLAEHLSNIQNDNIIRQFDNVIARSDEATLNTIKPDMVIYLGGHIVSKRLKHFLRQRTPNVCWHVAKTESVIDLFQSLSRMIHCSDIEFAKALPNDKNNADLSFIEQWKRLQKEYNISINNSFTANNIVGNFIKSMPKHSVLALANSSSVRYAQNFKLPDDTIVLCNRGVNGIDGSLSTAVGFALQTNRQVYVIIGDLSFFYDQNSLWNNELPNNLHILLLNDFGGAIFNSLPGLDNSKTSAQYIAAKHSHNASGIAQSFKINYQYATEMPNFCSIYNATKTSILECML